MNDLRYAIRSFLRTPGFTLVAVLTLALGIGATTAIFSVVNAVLLRPLPYADADRLVVTRGSLPDLRDLERSNRSFDGMATWASNLFNLRIDADSRQVLGGMVSRNLLPLLGVQPLLGRNFTEDDDRQDTVIIGYGLWQSRFGGDPGVLGRTIDLSGTSYTVIGVAPAWFRFPTAEFQLWAPLSSIDTKRPQQATNRALRIFSVVARLEPGVTLQQAQGDAAAVSARLSQEFPATNEGVTFEVVPVYERLVGAVKPALTILLGTVGLLLLIACANVANLMLARTTVREREMAIRIALGAGRGRLIRQLMIESVALAVAGGLIGLLLTMWGIDLLPAVLEARVPRADGIRIDATVLAFSMGATLLTGLLFGLAPALQTATAPSGSLKESGRGTTASSRGRRLRSTIVIVETALAVVVLVGAGLLVRSFLTLTARDSGFVQANLVSFNVQFVSLPDDASRAQAAALLMDQLAGLPGVEVAGASTGFPTVTPQRGTRFAVEGRTLTAGEDGAYFLAATPGYFEALRTPLLQGRAFDARDSAGAAPVVVVSRTLANQLFPGQDAVGHRLKLDQPRTAGHVADDCRCRRRREVSGARTGFPAGHLHAVRADAVPVVVRDGSRERTDGAADAIRARARARGAPVADRGEPAADDRGDRAGRRRAAVSHGARGLVRSAGAPASGDWHLRRPRVFGHAAHARDWRADGIGGRRTRRHGSRGPGGADARGGRRRARARWRGGAHAADGRAALRRHGARPADLRRRRRGAARRRRRRLLCSRAARDPRAADHRAQGGVNP